MYTPEVPEVILIANKHDNDVMVCMVAEFFEPSFDIFVRGMLRNIVNK